MPCPSESQLQAFAVGNVSSASFERLAEHLGVCQGCQATLARFDTYRDTLTAEIVPTRTAARAEVPPAVLSGALAAIAQPDHSRPLKEPTIDTGLHYANLLQEGPCRLGRF